jgi:MFS family permease
MSRLLPAVLREEVQFRRLFLGQALSMLGDRITFVALPFGVLAIGGSAGDVGLVIAASTLPFALFTLVGGVWADRLPRHRVMLVSDLVRCASQGLAAVGLLTGEITVLQLAVLQLVFGTADAFFSPAVTGIVPTVVPAARIQEATALRALVQSASLVVGPSLAGILVAVGGPGWALAVDAATFAVSAFFLARLVPDVAARLDEVSTSFLTELRQGFAEVRARSWVVSFLGGMAAYHVVVLPAVFVLGPVLAEQEYDGASSWAVVVAVFGVGSVAGNVIALRWRPSRPLAVAAVALVVASCQALIVGSGLSIAAIAALEGVTGVGVSLFFTLWESVLAEQIPERSISRVSSYDYLCSTGLMPVGLALAGPAADAFGIHATLHAMTIIGLPVALAVLAVPGVRALRRPAVAPGTA